VTIRLAQRIRRESTVRDGERIELEFGDARGDVRIPAILQLPTVAEGEQVAGVLLLHGLTSDKERMADTIGRVLLGHRIASLAIDLPLHGERREAAGIWTRNPLALMGAWRTAQDDARLALGYLGTREEVDAARLGVVGYSMGSFLGVTVAATANHVRALVLAAGGDLPNDTPYDRLVRTVADPVKAVRKLAGRPLLMVHGRFDRTVTPAQAQRLFDAAGEPKELRWWDAAHYLPDAAITDAARWLAERMR
jgi:predicted esterase